MKDIAWVDYIFDEQTNECTGVYVKYTDGTKETFGRDGLIQIGKKLQEQMGKV